MVFKRKFFKKQKYIKEQFPKDDDEIKALNDERFNVDRRLYNQTEFLKVHDAKPYLGFSLLSILSSIYEKNIKPSKTCGKKTLYNRLPAIKWLKNYHKDYALPDFLAGITVGIMHIPQGITFCLFFILTIPICSRSFCYLFNKVWLIHS